MRLIAIRETELSVDEVRPRSRARGAAASRCSSARSATTTTTSDVTGLSYTAHPSAEAELRRVAEAIAEKFPVAGGGGRASGR